jgi:putative transposase
MLIFCFLDLFGVISLTKNDKELEILILGQQIRILQRKITATPRIADPERMLLAALTDKFAHSCDHARQRLHQAMLIFKPDTVLRWHRELVRRKWTFRRKSNPGRPRLSSELEALIIQLAKENTLGDMKKSNLLHDNDTKFTSSFNPVPSSPV